MDLILHGRHFGYLTAFLLLCLLDLSHGAGDNSTKDAIMATPTSSFTTNIISTQSISSSVSITQSCTINCSSVILPTATSVLSSMPSELKTTISSTMSFNLTSMSTATSSLVQQPSLTVALTTTVSSINISSKIPPNSGTLLPTESIIASSMMNTPSINPSLSVQSLSLITSVTHGASMVPTPALSSTMSMKMSSVISTSMPPSTMSLSIMTSSITSMSSSQPIMPSSTTSTTSSSTTTTSSSTTSTTPTTSPTTITTTKAPPAKKPSKGDKSSGLSNGGVAAVVICILIVVVIGGFVTIKLLRRKKKYGNFGLSSDVSYQHMEDEDFDMFDFANFEDRERMDTLQNENEKLRAENNLLKEQISKISLSQDAAEQYSRRNNIRISGIPEKADESTDDLVLKLSQAVDASLSLENIDRSHRVGRPVSGKTRDIIVKMVSYRSRQKLIKQRKLLKDRGYKKVFLNEDLTRERSKIYFNARGLVKSGAILGAWTSDGTVLIKDKSNIVHRIINESQLSRYSAV